MLEITAKHNAVVDVINKFFPFGLNSKIKINLEDDLVKEYIKISKTGEIISDEYNNYSLYSNFNNCSALDYIQAISLLSDNTNSSNIIEISPGFNGNFTNCLHVKSENDNMIIKINSPKNVIRGNTYVLSFDIFVTDDTPELIFITNVEPNRIEDLINVKDEYTFVSRRDTGKWITKRYEINVPVITSEVPLPDASNYVDFNLNIQIKNYSEFYLDNLKLFQSKYEKIDNNFCNVGFVFSVINPIQNNGKILQSTDVVNYVGDFNNQNDTDKDDNNKIELTTVNDYNNLVASSDYDGKDIYLSIKNQIFNDTDNTFSLKNLQNKPNPPKLHLTIKNCTFEGNTSKDDINSSFMYLSNCQELVVDSCIFDASNVEEGLKHGIDLNLIQIKDAEAYITNSKFLGNYKENALNLSQRNGLDDVATDVKVPENQFPATIKAALVENCTFSGNEGCILGIGSQGKGVDNAASPSTGEFPLTIITNDTNIKISPLYKYSETDTIQLIDIPKFSTYYKTSNGDLVDNTVKPDINQTINQTDLYNPITDKDIKDNCCIDFEDQPYISYISTEEEKSYKSVSIIMNIPAITVADYQNNVLCRFEMYVYNPSKVEYIGSNYKYNPIQECVYRSEPFILTGYILPPDGICN